MPVKGSTTISTSPCSLMHISGNLTGNVAGCGRSLLLYRFVGDEPRVAPVALILLGRLPSPNVCLVLVRYPHSKLVKMGIAGFCKVENVFLAVVQEPLAHYWLEVADRDVAANVRVIANIVLVYCYRLDPVDDVLQRKVLLQDQGHVPGYPWILWLVAYVEKERAIV